MNSSVPLNSTTIPMRFSCKCSAGARKSQSWYRITGRGETNPNVIAAFSMMLNLSPGCVKKSCAPAG